MTAAPDLTAAKITEEDRLRADLYNFLGLILARPADQDLIDQIKLLAVQRRKTLQDCSAEAFRAWIAAASGRPS